VENSKDFKLEIIKIYLAVKNHPVFRQHRFAFTVVLLCIGLIINSALANLKTALTSNISARPCFMEQADAKPVFIQETKIKTSRNTQGKKREKSEFKISLACFNLA